MSRETVTAAVLLAQTNRVPIVGGEHEILPCGVVIHLDRRQRRICVAHLVLLRRMTPRRAVEIAACALLRSRRLHGHSSRGRCVPATPASPTRPPFFTRRSRNAAILLAASTTGFAPAQPPSHGGFAGSSACCGRQFRDVPRSRGLLVIRVLTPRDWPRPAVYVSIDRLPAAFDNYALNLVLAVDIVSLRPSRYVG